MSDDPILAVTDAGIGFNGRTLWQHLSLDVHAGDMIAILGANGSGKSTLLKAILGQLTLDSGAIDFLGEPIHHGDRRMGYIPQQHMFNPGTPLRGRDLVRLGIDGHRYGSPFSSRATNARVTELIASVGATDYAKRPIGDLSGGEQQRLRVAQALAGDPKLLICDEPFASLDIRNQDAIVDLIDARRTGEGTPVLFVTHDINPVLPIVTKVLYLAEGRFRIGSVDEVLRSEVLSELFDTKVDVVRSDGRLFVIGQPELHHEVPAHLHPHVTTKATS